MLDREFLQGEAGGGVTSLGRGCGGQGGELGGVEGGGRGGGSRYVDEEQVFAGEIEGEVLAGLKEAELADGLGRDAAGGEVGDAAVFELEANVGDIDLAGEDGKADGADLADWAGDEGEDDVEVVDHEVEDDVDVEGARGEDAEAVALEEHGAVEMRAGGDDGGVEAFEVAGLDDAVVLRGEAQDGVGVFEACGEGLFNQEVDACCEEVGGGLGVVDGGNGYGGWLAG